MKRIIVLLILAVSTITISQAQTHAIVKCNTPTCEEPGDPGFTSSPNNQLLVSSDAAKGKIDVAFNQFSSDEVEVGVFDTNGKCVKNKSLRIDKPVVKISFDLKKERAGIYTVKVTSFDRIHTADVYFK